MPTLTVIDLKQQIHRLSVKPGANLRRSILEGGLSPYTRFTQRLNCGGRGLCATCGVWILSGRPVSQHWHDRWAQRFAYPRLSCQIQVEQDMTIQLVDKWIWGKPDAEKGST